MAGWESAAWTASHCLLPVFPSTATSGQQRARRRLQGCGRIIHCSLLNTSEHHAYFSVRGAEASLPCAHYQKTTHVCRCSVSSLLPTAAASDLLVEQILDRMSYALGLHDYPFSCHLMATGRLSCFGLEGEWKLIWCLDGRFYEQFSGTEMEFEYGYDGKHSPWHADTGGYVTHLELDNLEACLSALWIKTGYWLTKKGREKLAICKRESRLLSNDVFANNELWLTISLRGKKVESHVLVDTTTWLPKRMEMKAFGGVENWEFANWTKVLPGYSLKFCMSTMYLPATGGEHHYLARTTGIAFHDDSPDVHVYDYHQTHLRPRAMDHYPRIQLDSSSSPSAKMIRVRSGHHLVRPLIDGKDMGYFIVDTGASGLVISRRKADELGMHAYGELYITGVEGKFKTRYRRSKSLQLGPLKISFPVFIEAPSDNIVKGVTEAVSGILGYDIFCRTIVEMSSVESRITFYDPLQFQPSNLEVNWKVVHMLDNTPHAEVKFLEQCALLMLDTGAGGIGVILHKRAVEEFDLLSRLDWKGQIVISGVGKTDESGGIKVQHGTLNRMEVGGQVFERVKTLYFDADDQVVDISIYNSGIVCGEIIMRHVLVLDYPNNRFAFVRSS